jgi:hypothetical protein
MYIVGYGLMNSLLFQCTVSTKQFVEIKGPFNRNHIEPNIPQQQMITIP